MWQPIAVSIPHPKHDGAPCSTRHPAASACRLAALSCRSRSGTTALRVVRNARSPDICLEMLFELVVARHFVKLTVFFVEAEPPAFFLREERRQRGSWLVDLLPVGDACDIHGFPGVFDGIDDAIVADPDAPFVHAAFELLASGGPGIASQLFDARRYAPPSNREAWKAPFSALSLRASL